MGERRTITNSCDCHHRCY